MSLLEDVAVVGGVALTLLKPVIALVVFTCLLMVIWMVFPRLWRLIRSTLWLAWHKLKMPGRRMPLDKPVDLKLNLPEETRDILRFRLGISEADLRWSVPSLSGKGKGVRGMSPNLYGLLIAPHKAECLYFAAGKGFRDRLFKVPLAQVAVEIESRFLSENVILTGPGVLAVFRFPRGQTDVAETVALRLRQMAQPPVPVQERVDQEPVKEIPAAPASTEKPQVDEPSIPLVPSAPAKSSAEEKLLPFPAVS
jgi:hypothetical protein